MTKLHRQPMSSDVSQSRKSVQAERMRQLLEIRHLKETDVAKFLGISERVYQKLELSEYDIPATALMQLAVLYGVTTDFLVGLSDDLAAAGRIQNQDSVDFLRIMLETRASYQTMYQKFRAIIHGVSSEPDADVFEAAAKQFPQYAEQLLSQKSGV